ncbi:MAG: hypothetical protein M3063_07305 [Actinomycetota bacterium]|nr:hypothetical protein [Actinomycetota bacterium]
MAYPEEVAGAKEAWGEDDGPGLDGSAVEFEEARAALVQAGPPTRPP